MKKEDFLRQFPKEMEYLASKLYNSYEIARNYEIISFTEEFYTPNFWKKLVKKMGGVNIACDGVFTDSDRRQIAFVPDIFINGNDDFENFYNDIDRNSENFDIDDEKIKSYGIKVENKEFYINSLTKKEEVYSKKLLDLNKVKELETKGTRRIVVENSIVTSSAEEYAKEKNIEIIKRR